MSAPALRFAGVNKSFGRAKVLHDISFEIERGAFFGLVGINGAGKTTLLKCLLDFCTFDSGSIGIFGAAHDAPGARATLAFLPERLNDTLGSTSIVVTHDVQEALDIVDYVYYLSEGVMVAHGTPEEMRASKDPLVHQFVWGEADGPVAYQYPSRKFNEELGLV